MDRKPVRDTSTDFYRTFLQKCKGISRDHHRSESNLKIVKENQYLLDKIARNKNSNLMTQSEIYHINLHERRNREIEKINQENLRMVKRITEQPSVLRKTVHSRDPWQTSKDKSF